MGHRKIYERYFHFIGDISSNIKTFHKSQVKRVTFYIHTQYSAKTISGGYRSIRTYFPCALWGAAADKFLQNFKAHDYVWVKGYPSITTWKDDNGKTRQSVEFTVQEIKELPYEAPKKKKDPVAEFGNANVLPPENEDLGQLSDEDNEPYTYLTEEDQYEGGYID